MRSLQLNLLTAETTNLEQPSGSNLPTDETEPLRVQEDKDEDKEEWSFLTQYIGPSPSSKKKNPPMQEQHTAGGNLQLQKKILSGD